MNATHPWRTANAAMLREDRGPRRLCPCGEPIPEQTTGRPRVWCSRACKDRAYRTGEATHGGEVDTSALRRAFQRSGLSKCEVARRMGWTKVVPNLHRLDVTLGLTADAGRRARSRVTYDLALRLVEAMDADPIDCGV